MANTIFTDEDNTQLKQQYPHHYVMMEMRQPTGFTEALLKSDTLPPLHVRRYGNTWAIL